MWTSIGSGSKEDKDRSDFPIIEHRIFKEAIKVTRKDAGFNTNPMLSCSLSSTCYVDIHLDRSKEDKIDQIFR